MNNALAACQAGLFVFRKALTRFPFLLKIRIHLLRDMFDLLLAILVLIHGEAGPKILLPHNTSLIFRLMGSVVVDF